MRVLIWLSMKKPIPKIVIPTSMMRRGPNLSRMKPWIGPSSPASTIWIEKAIESAVRLHPNSSTNSTT